MKYCEYLIKKKSKGITSKNAKILDFNLKINCDKNQETWINSS
jgi:hypothetical protein